MLESETKIEDETDLIPVSVLDENDVFVGTAKVPKGEVHPERHLPQVPNCDLPPGQYKWNRDAQTFEHLAPLGKRKAERILGDAKAITAIVKGFEAAHKAGVPMPKETLHLIDAHNMMQAGTEKLRGYDPTLKRFKDKE